MLKNTLTKHENATMPFGPRTRENVAQAHI